MRREELYLTDIIDAAEAIGRFIEGVDYDDFLGDELCQSAILQKLIVIGEAAPRLSPDFRATHPTVEWADIVAFRNIAVHQYFAVNWRVVWVTATEDVPFLRQHAARIPADEYAGE